ncbi:MAG: orotate phosphoribosyltransferase [Candidatus Omnitrophica bacterium]|nr:orotate phosphoribosyltransferase [Candidatus Omnitrophota bacterium]
MRPSEIMTLFKECGAWQEGHFELSSGQHSREYLQCAMVLQYPTLCARLCQSLAERFLGDDITCVAAPAMGGILIGYEVAKYLGVRSIFSERHEGKMTLRRTFQVGPKDKVLVTEDVVTTGGSVEELITLIRDAGASVVGVGALVDRSGGWVAFDVKYHALISLHLRAFPPPDCPMCREGLPVIKPGSRSLREKI